MQEKRKFKEEQREKHEKVPIFNFSLKLDMLMLHISDSTSQLTTQTSISLPLFGQKVKASHLPIQSPNNQNEEEGTNSK